MMVTRVFPAPAGMNRRLSCVWRVFLGVPRASGDEPSGVDVDFMVFYVFPAPAGMNRRRHQRGPGNRCVPRASGDEPDNGAFFLCILACSPRQRG